MNRNMVSHSENNSVSHHQQVQVVGSQMESPRDPANANTTRTAFQSYHVPGTVPNTRLAQQHGQANGQSPRQPAFNHSSLVNGFSNHSQIGDFQSMYSQDQPRSYNDESFEYNNDSFHNTSSKPQSLTTMPPESDWNPHLGTTANGVGYGSSSRQAGLFSSFGSSNSVSAATAIANIASLINSSTSNGPRSQSPGLQSPALFPSSTAPTMTSHHSKPHYNGHAFTPTAMVNGQSQYNPSQKYASSNMSQQHTESNGSVNGGNGETINSMAKTSRPQMMPDRAILLQRELEQERSMRSQLQQRVLELNQKIHAQHLVEKGYEDVVQKYKMMYAQNQQMSMAIERYQAMLKQMDHEKRTLYNENAALKSQENAAQDNKAMLYNILMERSKKLEEENSSLVLENETYQRQYEKCIDEISKQVVQALLTQKALQEQCIQLQERLGDLERENSEFSEAALRQARQASSDSRLGWSYRSNRARTHAASPSADSVRSMPAQHHYWRQGSISSLEHQHHNESLNNERIPEHSDQSPWTPNQEADKAASATSGSSDAHSISIETEFPANNGSPKSTKRSLDRHPSSGSLDSAYHSRGFVKYSGKDVRCQRSVSAEALRDMKVTMRPKHDLTLPLPKSNTAPVINKERSDFAAQQHTIQAEVHNDLSPGSTVDPANMTDSGVVNDPFADDADDILSKHQSLIVGSMEDLFGAIDDEGHTDVRHNVIIEEELSGTNSGTSTQERRGGVPVAPTPPPRPRSRCLSDCSYNNDSSRQSHHTEASFHSSVDLRQDLNGPPPLPPKQYKGSRRPYKPLPAEPPDHQAYDERDDSSDKNTDSESIKQEINALTSKISYMASSAHH